MVLVRITQNLAGFATSVKQLYRIFIIEGIITAVFALIAYFLVPASLETARFLKPEEKSQLAAILRRDSDATDTEPFNWRGVKAALMDPQVRQNRSLWRDCPDFVFHSSSISVLGLWYAVPLSQLLALLHNSLFTYYHFWPRFRYLEIAAHEYASICTGFHCHDGYGVCFL